MAPGLLAGKLRLGLHDLILRLPENIMSVICLTFVVETQDLAVAGVGLKPSNFWFQ